MQHELSESIKSKISKEADSESLKVYESITKEGHEDSVASAHASGLRKGYTAAAESILSNPGEWSLAGVWVKADQRLPLSYWNGPVRFGLKCDHWVYGTRTGVSLSQDLRRYPDIEWLDESASPSTDRVALLEAALKKIVSACDTAGKSMERVIEEIYQTAKGALKQ